MDRQLNHNAVGRRVLLRAAAWSAPLIAVAAAAPARAASGDQFAIVTAVNTFQDYLYVTVAASTFFATGSNSWSFTSRSGQPEFVRQTTLDTSTAGFHYYTLRFPGVTSFAGGTLTAFPPGHDPVSYVMT